MRKVVLDTSFILTAVRQKIDFFEHIKGMHIVIPEQTIIELRGLGANLALKILEKNRNEFEIARIPGKDADSAIVAFARKNPEAVVATLDQGLQKKIKNPKLIIRNLKKLEII